MSDEESRVGVRFITSLSAVLYPSKGGAPLDDRATAHEISAKGFKLETQSALAVNTLIAFTLVLPMGGTAAGKGRVVWSTSDAFATWAGVEIVSMSWRDKRRLNHQLHPEAVDWTRVLHLSIKVVMALTVVAAGQKVIQSAELRELAGELAPKILALFLMGWALTELLKSEKS